MESKTIYVVVTDSHGKHYKKAWGSHAERPFIIRYTIEGYACDMKYEIDLDNIVKVEVMSEDDYIKNYSVTEIVEEEVKQVSDFIF